MGAHRDKEDGAVSDKHCKCWNTKFPQRTPKLSPKTVQKIGHKTQRQNERKDQNTEDQCMNSRKKTEKMKGEKCEQTEE